MTMLNEEFWSVGRAAQIANDHKVLFWGIILTYLPLVYFCQYLMRNFNAMQLKSISFLWNITLSTLSGLGALTYLYQPSILLRLLVPESDIHIWIRVTMGLFGFSKVVEFGDTFLLVLKKKPLIFLHVYHHFTVALYCWYSHSIYSPCGHLFCFINLVIHWWMYLYYAFSITLSRRHWLLRIIRPYITISQILQMVVGMTLAYYAGQHPETTGSHRFNCICALIMYISYGYLFTLFYLETYVKGVHPIMTTVVICLHLSAALGLKFLCSHSNRVRLAIELIVCSLITYVLIQRFMLAIESLLITKKSDSIMASSRVVNKLSHSSLIVWNSWMVWAIERQQLQKIYAEVFCSKERNISINTSHSVEYSKRPRTLTQDLMADFTPLTDQLSKYCCDGNPQTLRKSSHSRISNLAIIYHYFGPERYVENCLLFALSIIFPALYSKFVYNSYLCGILIHGCLRWCLELHFLDGIQYLLAQ